MAGSGIAEYSPSTPFFLAHDAVHDWSDVTHALSLPRIPDTYIDLSKVGIYT